VFLVKELPVDVTIEPGTLSSQIHDFAIELQLLSNEREREASRAVELQLLSQRLAASRTYHFGRGGLAG
jgi:hypothetical protein